ncbi:MAG: NapC/NirT family cytochrome c [Methanocellales archaeon]|nr:NapC/NirT family cytochrome c [Methanocellales archaeon]
MNQKKFIIILFLVFLIIGCAATVRAIHFTKENAFCGSCHVMESYYLNYSTSSDPMPYAHSQAGVKCYDCHFESDVLGRVEARKLVANMILLYILDEYEMPACDMLSERCIRCHPDYLEQTTNGVNPHLGVGDCISCHHPHKETGLSDFFTYDCSVCHSTSLAGVHEPMKCRGCHVQHASFPNCVYCHESHTQTQTDNSNCILCHGKPHNISGELTFSPDISKKLCRVCHAEQYSTLARYNEAHNTFVGEHKDAMRTYTYNFKKSCIYCHPAHAQARGCTSPGCHFNHYHPIQDGCSWCHVEEHWGCMKCHTDPHAPKISAR